MVDTKKLYFIPIIAQALESGDPKKAMQEAFNKIQALGTQPEYKEGFRQFLELVKTAVKPSDEDSEEKIQQIKNATYSLIYDLATDTFEGDEAQKEALINALEGHPQWKAEYERIKNEAQDFLAPETEIEIEVLRENQIIGSFLISTDPSSLGSISPGRYTVRFSNGRVLWEGDVSREDVLWTFAYPEKDLPMAAETEPSQREPTRTISLLDGELLMHIFAGLETGELRFESGEHT